MIYQVNNINFTDARESARFARNNQAQLVAHTDSGNVTTYHHESEVSLLSIDELAYRAANCLCWEVIGRNHLVEEVMPTGKVHKKIYSCGLLVKVIR